MRNEQMERYLQLLERCDWTFEFSDDHRVWQRGRARMDELQQLRAVLDHDRAIWNQYAPANWQVV